jgi:hypothetical protein
MDKENSLKTGLIIVIKIKILFIKVQFSDYFLVDYSWEELDTQCSIKKDK